MIIAKQNFIFVNKRNGVNSDGVKYVAFTVLSKADKHQLSFVAKRPELLSKIENMKFTDFQEIDLVLDFNRSFNPNTRYSRWDCELVDVGNTIQSNH